MSDFDFQLQSATDNDPGIRTAVLEGDVDKALKLTRAFYPSVLQENENVYFKLRCRKFIELICQCTDLQQSTKNRRQNSGSVSAGLNGHSAIDNHNSFDGHMDIDDQSDHHDNGEADGMDVEDLDASSKQNDLVHDALQYGQDLQSEFKDDPRREVKQALEDTFALIAYPNARESSLAPLLETDGRIPVAEELNSAILGKSSLRLP